MEQAKLVDKVGGELGVMNASAKIASAETARK